MRDREDPTLIKPIKNRKNNKKRNPRGNRATRCLPTQVVQVLKPRSGCKNSEKIWWVMKFLNAETHTPVLLMKYRYSPHSRDREDLCKHNVEIQFPKDRDCEICQRTKITRAPCRRRNGGAVLRAENFGVLITADHKVLSDNCESRNNHRYAVVVQDLATQWIQSYPCKTKTSQETQRSSQKFLGARKEA